MLKNRATRIAIIGAAALAVIAGTAVATAANAAVQPNGSDVPVYIGDSNSNALVPAGTTFHWTDDTFGFTNPADVSAPFSCPADAQNAISFLAPKGQERTMSAWSAWGQVGFYPAGSKTVSQFPTALYAQIIGNAPGVKTTGGDYSIGLACTINNDVKLASAGVFFASVHVTAGSGNYTVDQPTGDVVVTPPTGSADLHLKATTLAAADGVLSLVAPTNTTVLIGNPVLDPISKLSTSTGTLGDVTVSDGRVVTHRGWELSAAVTDFALEGDASKTIGKAQLGFAPKIVSSPTGATGVTKAAAQPAGSAVYAAAFAAADNGPVVGNTVVNADLTFVAPATAAAGTYNSTLTLTLVGK
jgi:hypothetical protein